VSFLRIKAVSPKTGLSRTTIWRMVQIGTFPAPKRLGVRAVGWEDSAVEEWCASRPDARETHTEPQAAQTP
jgi:prophage regulatory protein